VKHAKAFLILISDLGDPQMNKKLQDAMKVGVLALALTMAAGCASQELKDAVASAQSAADAAKASADAAKASADAASRAASDAKQMASSAQSTADQAARAAAAAQACCDRNAEKIDRMFEKAMRK
jgi:cell division septum initiation protein DivIVA